MRVVFDASVAAKLFIDEDDSSLARALASEMDILAPDLVIAELCNLFWKRLRLGGISQEDAHHAIEVLPKFIELIAIASLAPAAIALSSGLDHPAYDCFYLALARDRELPLITADRRLINRIQGSDLDVRLLELYQVPN
ncbi:MAG: type II toxin-antitoxin system VapC family toxin [Rhodospirillales bacterium]|nr:type II toxin-antitoxin system VapC family toxin [Rhodospirillales bacterium]